MDRVKKIVIFKASEHHFVSPLKGRGLAILAVFGNDAIKRLLRRLLIRPLTKLLYILIRRCWFSIPLVSVPFLSVE